MGGGEEEGAVRKAGKRETHWLKVKGYFFFIIQGKLRSRIIV